MSTNQDGEIVAAKAPESKSLKLRFLGTGSAFAPLELGQTNALLTDNAGRNLLIDCGSDCRHMLANHGLGAKDIDAVYISHLHADHVGGLEWLAFNTYFNPNVGKPALYANHRLMHQMWEKSLRGGLESVQNKVCNLTDYFDCRSVVSNTSFFWGHAKFSPVQTVHVMNGLEIVHSYGLMVDLAPDFNANERNSLKGPTRIFYTADTQFAPKQLLDFYSVADLVFHDCETTPFRSNVHAHIDDLATLPDDVKKKMFLMHYSPIPDEDMDQLANKLGFAGFLRPGEDFDLNTYRRPLSNEMLEVVEAAG